jgi:hypothetical protein
MSLREGYKGWRVVALFLTMSNFNYIAWYWLDVSIICLLVDGLKIQGKIKHERQ